MVNRIIKLLLSISMIAVSFTILDTPVFNFVENVQGDQYGLACSNYEVDIANPNGTFTSKGCYGDFKSARSAMEGLGMNAVVRHGSSKSPMKIIAMNADAGVAISYPARSAGATMDVKQESGTKVTYVTNHREMRYGGTYNYNGSGDGDIYVTLTGFPGLTRLINVDLVPLVFMGNDTRVLLGGNDTSSKNEQPFWTHVYQSHYEVTQNGANKELTYYAYSGWADSSTYPAKYTMTVGLAADWMSVGTIYYSSDGYNFYFDGQYKNEAGTYYNYYQFLPTRTKTEIPASVFDNFLISVKGSNTNSKMKDQGQTFINAQNTYGMNALLIYALACLESAYGTSDFALNRNNLFGWNAFDSDPGQASYFSSIEAAINEHMGINLRGYTNINDSRFFGSHVGNKGSGFNVKYAADPYWGYKIAAIAYSIDKASGFKDLNKYSVGVINKYGVNVLKSPNGATLFNSAYGATYQENFTVALLGNESNHYKIQSTNPVSGGNIVTGDTKGLVTYDWNQSVGYIPTGYVTQVGGASIVQPGTYPTGSVVNSVSKIEIKDNKLVIEGLNYLPGIYVTDENKLSQSIVIMNSFFESMNIPATTKVTDNDKAGYSVTIDLSTLANDKYFFKIKSDYSKFTSYNQLEYIGKGLTAPTKVSSGGKIYDFLVKDDTLYLTISNDSTPTPTPTVTPTPLPTPIPTAKPVEKQLVQEVYKFEQLDAENIVIEGIAFISGIATDNDANISHEIYMMNMETKETYPFEIQTSSLDLPIDLNDGFTYSKVKYSGTLNIKDIGKGDYAIYVKVKNKDIEKKAELYNYYVTNVMTEISSDVLKKKLLVNTNYGYRYEYRVTNSKLDLSVINKPNRNVPTFDFTTIKLSDGKMSIDAFAWISSVDTTKENNPQYKLIFQNEETGDYFEKSVTNKACTIDYTKELKLKYATSNACFDGDTDISDLPNGKYIIYLDMSVGKYRDIIEIYDYYAQSKQSNSYNGKNYSLDKSNVRSRIMLSITDN